MRNTWRNASFIGLFAFALILTASFASAGFVICVGDSQDCNTFRTEFFKPVSQADLLEAGQSPVPDAPLAQATQVTPVDRAIFQNVGTSTKGAAIGIGNSQYDDLILASESRYSVDPRLVKTIIKFESNFKPSAHPGKGSSACGLMQIISTTWNGACPDVPFSQCTDPAMNIECGTRVLAPLASQAGGDPKVVYCMYGLGLGANECRLAIEQGTTYCAAQYLAVRHPVWTPGSSAYTSALGTCTALLGTYGTSFAASYNNIVPFNADYRA